MIHDIKIPAGTILSEVAIMAQLTLINIALGRGKEVVMTIDKSVFIMLLVEKILRKNYQFTLVKSKGSDVIVITFPNQTLEGVEKINYWSAILAGFFGYGNGLLRFARNDMMFPTMKGVMLAMI